jgi:hypothetical protein
MLHGLLIVLACWNTYLIHESQWVFLMKNVAMNHTTVDFLDKFGTRGHSPLHLLVRVAFFRKTELRMGTKTSSTTSEVNNGYTTTILKERMTTYNAEQHGGLCKRWNENQPIYIYTLHLLLLMTPQIPLQRRCLRSEGSTVRRFGKYQEFSEAWTHLAMLPSGRNPWPPIGFTAPTWGVFSSHRHGRESRTKRWQPFICSRGLTMVSWRYCEIDKIISWDHPCQ